MTKRSWGNWSSRVPYTLQLGVETSQAPALVSTLTHHMTHVSLDSSQRINLSLNLFRIYIVELFCQNFRHFFSPPLYILRPLFPYLRL